VSKGRDHKSLEECLVLRQGSKSVETLLRGYLNNPAWGKEQVKAFNKDLIKIGPS
jgi:hypothetical protein